MHRFIKLGAALGGVSLLSLARAGSGEPSAESLCHDWFGQAARSAPLTLADPAAVVSEVTLDGRPAGWLFRTDQVEPVCKGKRGQIAVLVAIGTDARIKGLTVLAHKEDAPYFKRLKDPFFHQFENRRVDGGTAGLDAVTKATFSSRAIIRDVIEGSRRVLALPEVAAKLSPAQKGG